MMGFLSFIGFIAMPAITYWFRLLLSCVYIIQLSKTSATRKSPDFSAKILRSLNFILAFISKQPHSLFRIRVTDKHGYLSLSSSPSSRMIKQQPRPTPYPIITPRAIKLSLWVTYKYRPNISWSLMCKKYLSYESNINY